MLDVQKSLISNGGNLALLNQEYGINAIKHPTDSRVILNYDQIASSKMKFEPIVRECRALTLDSNDWSLCARGFYRFFNWGEYPNEMKKFQFEGSVATFKEDGSYIVVYYWNGEWHVQTRGSFGGGNVNDFITWRQLFMLAAPENFFQRLEKTKTYVFELCSRYNQVVRLYNTPSLFLLTVFDGEVELLHPITKVIGKEIGVEMPEEYSFGDIMDVEAFIANLERTDKTFEGFVLRDRNNLRFKMKNSTYLMLHRMANNGNIQSESRLIEYILNGELDEVICYFPYVEKQARALEEKLQKIMETMSNHWFCFKDEKSRKKFALAIKDCPFNNFLFEAKTKYDNGETDINPITLMRASPEKVTRVL